MKTISQSLIRECATNDAVYQRGYELFADERVQKLNIVHCLDDT